MLTKEQFYALMPRLTALKSSVSLKSLSYIKDCKPKALQNALKAYASECAAADAVAMLDTSFFGSGKAGYLLSHDGIYSDTFVYPAKKLKSTKIPLSGLTSVAEEVDEYTNRVIAATYEDGTRREYFGGTDTEFILNILNLILSETAAIENGVKFAKAKELLENGQRADAAALMLELCESEYTPAYPYGAEYYMEKKQYEVAYPLLEKTADGGDLSAMKDYCKLYYTQSSRGYSNRKAAEYLRQILKAADKGDSFYFGFFGGKPLPWRILEKTKDECLAFCEHCIDYIDFQEREFEYSWHKSRLRRILNTDIYENSFGRYEKALISEKEITTEQKDYKYITHDRLFCLSLYEVLKYFDSAPEDSASIYKRLYKGDFRMHPIKDEAAKARLHYGTDKKCCMWWLRSLGFEEFVPCIVTEDGKIDDGKFGFGYNEKIAARPAMWLKW